MEILNYSHIVIRFGELSTKGKNRKDFISLLLNNLKNQLKTFSNLKFEKTHDRLFIHLNGEDVGKIKDVVEHCFGISSYSIAIKTALAIEDIQKCALDLVKEKDYRTFKIEAKRQDKSFSLNSHQINCKIASYILSNHKIKVDVHKPDVLIKVEVRKECAYLMSNKIRTLGGFPVGINGKSLLMVSGGIDSPVAGFLTMKRGLRIECIHFESSPYTSLEAQKKVLDLVGKLSKYQSEIIVHIIPFTKLQLAIYQNCDESYAITIMRRMMYRIADEIAKKKKILCISNGESIGQVASQTVESSYVISKVTDRVIYRPLCAMDKVEIIDLAKHIDTYETSILPYEDCCTIFDPKQPVTKPKLDRVQFYEQKFDYKVLIEEAIKNEKIERINYNNFEEEIF